MLSKKAKYALKALIYLGRKKSNEMVLISEISEHEHIPKKFLEQILLEMKKHFILHSKRGKEGGYFLSKDPSEINIGNIIRVIDGPLAPIPCVSRLGYQKCDECLDETTCEIRFLMKKVRDATCDILDNATLEDLLKLEGRINLF
jgi:Rrf2 family protein